MHSVPELFGLVPEVHKNFNLLIHMFGEIVQVLVEAESRITTGSVTLL